MTMIRKVEQTIRKYSMLEKGDRVVVALSGGRIPARCLGRLRLLRRRGVWN